MKIRPQQDKQKKNVFSAEINPNPATTDLVIKINDNRPNQTYYIQLVDLHGNVKYTTTVKNKQITIAIGSLSEGVYVVLLYDNNHNFFAKKILKL